MKPKPCCNPFAVLPAIVFLSITCCSAAETKASASAPPTSESAIRTIRQEVQNIEESAPKFRRVAIPWEGRSTEGGELAGYYQQQTLRKIVEDCFGETGRSITELYFQSNRLIFAVSTKKYYKRPLVFDEKARDLEVERKVQERCWFFQGRLIAASGDDGKRIALSSAQAKALSEDMAATAKEAVAALSKAKPHTFFDDGPGKHPVESKVDALLANPRCTLDETSGARMAAQLWDDELNRVYRELRSKLDASDANALQDAQRRWIAWRDAEFGFTGSMYFRQPGSIFQPMSEHHKMNIVRSRAFDLQHWLEMQDFCLEHQRERDALEKSLHP